MVPHKIGKIQVNILHVWFVLLLDAHTTIPMMLKNWDISYLREVHDNIKRSRRMTTRAYFKMTRKEFHLKTI